MDLTLLIELHFNNGYPSNPEGVPTSTNATHKHKYLNYELDLRPAAIRKAHYDTDIGAQVHSKGWGRVK